jgi:hypothetical protein
LAFPWELNIDQRDKKWLLAEVRVSSDATAPPGESTGGPPVVNSADG